MRVCSALVAVLAAFLRHANQGPADGSSEGRMSATGRKAEWLLSGRLSDNRTLSDRVPGLIDDTPQVVRWYVPDDAGSIKTYPAHFGANRLLHPACFLY